MELEKAAHAPAKHPAETIENKSQDTRADEQPEERIQRKEQNIIDKIMRGELKGHYYLLLGPKGSGKTTMMIQSVGLHGLFKLLADQKYDLIALHIPDD